MKKILYLLLFLVISTPVIFASSSFSEKMMNSWLGYSISNLIDCWGYPTEEKTIANKHIFIWNTNYSVYVPQRTTSNVVYNNVYSNSYGGYNVNYYCKRTIEVNKDNTIIAWQQDGNGCIDNYSQGKHLVNPKNDEWAIAKALKAKEKAEKKEAKQRAKAEKAHKHKLKKEN